MFETPKTVLIEISNFLIYLIFQRRLLICFEIRLSAHVLLSPTALWSVNGDGQAFASSLLDILNQHLGHLPLVIRLEL